MSVYKLMEKDWKVYCLMSSILYIEEMAKPVAHIQIKKRKNKVYNCVCFRSLRLKMKDEEVINKIFNITKIWEKRKNISLIGKSFLTPRKEKFSDQDMFIFTPMWINYILTECGTIPNKYSFDTAIDRINNLKHYKKRYINKNKKLFNLFFKNKKLAAGAFVISMDLEFRGLQNGKPSLCMSNKFKDFLEFMLKVAKKWNWTHNRELSPISMVYNRKLGINASPQYELRIHTKALEEIYKLAGPLANSKKDRCISFNIKRSKSYINKGGRNRFNNTGEKLLKTLRKLKHSTSTELQFYVNIGTDVVLDHLHRLEKNGLVIKQRRGKRYVWRPL